jgi:hypothetical protein
VAGATSGELAMSILSASLGFGGSRSGESARRVFTVCTTSVIDDMAFSFCRSALKGSGKEFISAGREKRRQIKAEFLAPCRLTVVADERHRQLVGPNALVAQPLCVLAHLHLHPVQFIAKSEHNTSKSKSRV